MLLRAGALSFRNWPRILMPREYKCYAIRNSFSVWFCRWNYPCHRFCLLPWKVLMKHDFWDLFSRLASITLSGLKMPFQTSVPVHYGGVSVGKTVLVTLREAWQSHNCLISRLKGQDAHRGLKLERRAILGWKLHGSVFRCWSPSFGLSLKWMFQFINTSEAATEPAVLHKGRLPWW